MRTELLSNVSHELRTPLATVKGYSTMLLDYDRRLRRDEKRKYLRFIDKASDRLVELIDQLLDMSRLEAGLTEIKKEPASISRLIKEVVAETQVRKPGRQLVMDLPKRLPRSNIDARRIRQVLENLIDNAIKYSGEEMEVVISARQVRRKLLVSVTDRGIGIPGDDLPRVFDRIYRTRQRKVIEVGGAGLGLSICQKLVEAHKGRIWIESEEGKGTAVFFTLPLAVPKKGGQCKKA
ncbi:Sensor protein kinase WalK [subsurface metagenome]